MKHLTPEDFDAIERCVLPLDEILPPPYDSRYMTAFFRCSMLGIALKPMQAQLMGIRMQRFMTLPEMSVK